MENPAIQFQLIDAILIIPGVILLIIWLTKTSLGQNALAGANQRPNNMRFYTPFIPFAIWMAAISLAQITTEKFFTNLPDWQIELVNISIFCAAAVFAIFVTLFLARKHFYYKLKGFGLNLRTAPADFAIALLNLIAAWPVVLLAIIITIFAGKMIVGPNFNLHQHDQLITLTENPQLSLRIIIIITAVLIAPIFEEMLFRGLFQSVILSYTARPWIAIFLSAWLFAIVHPYSEHWPALFVLGVFLGYSYEKSGSLLRPIFIHLLFNAASITTTLLTT